MPFQSCSEDHAGVPAISGSRPSAVPIIDSVAAQRAAGSPQWNRSSGEGAIEPRILKASIAVICCFTVPRAQRSATSCTLSTIVNPSTSLAILIAAFPSRLHARTTGMPARSSLCRRPANVAAADATEPARRLGLGRCHRTECLSPPRPPHARRCRAGRRPPPACRSRRRADRRAATRRSARRPRRRCSSASRWPAARAPCG